jgi:hypothetical protein
MDYDSFNRGGKIPTFDGQIQNFPIWWKKFSAYATMVRIKSILKEDRDLHLPETEVSEIDETDEKGKSVRLAVNSNELAMASFSIAFTTEKAMNIIYADFTENSPDGEAHLVVRELYKRYRPLDTVSKVVMRQHLSRVKMKKGMNPSELFETLTSIQNQCLGPAKRLPKDEIIAIILDVASEEYQSILAIERRLKGEDLTMEDMEKAMCEE